MPETIQEFVAAATQRAMDDLIAALLALPEEKRHWRPLDKGRTALDQVAECVVTNKYVAVLIESACVPNGTERLPAAVRAVLRDGEAWNREKAEFDRDAETGAAALRENTGKLVAALRAVPTASLDAEIELPWETTTVTNVMGYPLWNMSYHEGQINYIATLLS
jgi:hypothetical protein